MLWCQSLTHCPPSSGSYMLPAVTLFPYLGLSCIDMVILSLGWNNQKKIYFPVFLQSTTSFFLSCSVLSFFLCKTSPAPCHWLPNGGNTPHRKIPLSLGLSTLSDHCWCSRSPRLERSGAAVWIIKPKERSRLCVVQDDGVTGLFEVVQAKVLHWEHLQCRQHMVITDLPNRQLGSSSPSH